MLFQQKPTNKINAAVRINQILTTVTNNGQEMAHRLVVFKARVTRFEFVKKRTLRLGGG